MKETRRQSNKTFNFGESSYKSTGIVEIPVTLKGKKFYLSTEILKGDVPWLIGKRTMSNMEMRLNLKENTVEIGALGGMKVNLWEDKQGHLRLKVTKKKVREDLLLEGWRGKNKREMRAAIMKLHLQFGHGSGDKIWRLTEEAKWSEGLEKEEIGEVKKMVMELTGNCEVCKRYKRNPAKPVVGFSWSKTFNEAVAMDIGEINGRKFLVIVDLATRYCQAYWIRDKKPETIIRSLINGWFVFFGTPSKILSDNGGEFQNEQVRRMTEKWNIRIFATAAESPWSNGLCEKTVGLLKESMRKLKEEEGVDSEVALKWVVCARNCLVNNGGFSPNQLVFGKNPILPNLTGEDGSSPASREKGSEEEMAREALNAMHKAREIHIKNESCDKIRVALNKRVRVHKFDEAVVGDEVFYKREDENEWRGPAQVVGISGKTVVVKHGNSLREVARVHITRIQGLEEGKDGRNQERNNSSTDVRRDTPAASCEEMKKADGQGTTADTERRDTVVGAEEDDWVLGRKYTGASVVPEAITVPVLENGDGGELRIPRLQKGNRIRAVNKDTGEQEEWTILSLAGKRTSKLWSDSYNVQDMQTGDRSWVNLRDYERIETIKDEEEVLLGFEDVRIIEAKEDELQSWRQNHVYEEVEDVGQKAISTRWVVTEKVKGGEKICKARLVARGFEEEMAEWEKDAPTCNAETLKFCLTVIKVKKWKSYSLDVKTAYLQGDEIQREVYIRPPNESDWRGLWRLRKTVYGLKDAAKAWYCTVEKLVKDLGGERSKLEPNVFFWKANNKLSGILCSHVDDFCYGGTESFLKSIIGKLKEKLQVGEQESGQFKYIGVEVEQREDGIRLNQRKYINSIREPESRKFSGNRMLNNKEMTEYRSVVGQLNWLSLHTMPEISYDVSELSKAFKEGTTKDMRKVIKVVRKVKSIMGEVVLRELEEKNLHWEAYADASFGNIEDGHTQIGYIISLTDGMNRCPIWWKSRKARRVAKSTIEAEALSVGEAIEGVIYFNRLWKEIVGERELEALVMTDSKTLMTAIKSSTGVSSKRLKIDIAAIRETIESGEIREVQWVEGKQQVADVLTKSGVSGEMIRCYVEN